MATTPNTGTPVSFRKLECDLIHAQNMTARARGETEEAESGRALYWLAFSRMTDAMYRLAAMPAPDRFGLARKKRLFRGWLDAEGDEYNPYRVSVAADEARFPTKRKPGKGKKPGSAP